MKKLEKLTLKELRNSNEISVLEDIGIIKGGDGSLPFGWGEYYAKYGTTCPSDTGYNPATDTCYPITNSSTYPPGYESIPSGLTMNEIYDQHWRSASGASGSDESAQRVDTPMLELLWKRFFGTP